MTAIEHHIDKQKSKRDWAKHRAAADAAVAAGADFDCAQRIGFAATSGLKVRPRLCAKCLKRGIAQQRA